MNPSITIEKDRTLAAALVASVVIHVILLLPFMKNVLLKDISLPSMEEVVAVPMEFELVSPPENPTPPDRISKYLSTVSSRASDVVETRDKGDVPHGEGTFPIPDNPFRMEGAEGGGKSEIPPLPQQEDDLGEALNRSKFLSETSPRREASLPDQTIDFKNPGSAQATINGISLNTTAWDFAPYLLDMKYRIKQHWIPPLAFTALGAVHGYTWVRFRIMPDGNLADLEVIEQNGHESLARSSVSAVRGAAPFRRLPEDFPEPYLEVTFGFYYLLPGDEFDMKRREH
jgi:hypothetical protein